MIIFKRELGKVFWDQAVTPFGDCWSGHGAYRNDPAHEYLKGLGVLPHGDYRLGPMEVNHGHLGPDVMSLTPMLGTDTRGRSGFFWHGDHPNDFDWSASDGCMISARATRIMANTAHDRIVRVV